MASSRRNTISFYKPRLTQKPTKSHLSLSIRERIYESRAFELTVDTLQYIINKGFLYKLSYPITAYSSNSRPNKNEFLSIVNFPSVQIEESDEIRHTSRYQGFYYDAYEEPQRMLSHTEMLKNFEGGHYINNLMVKAPGEQEYAPKQSYQNITYVKNAIESISTGDPTKYTCDLQGIPLECIFTEIVQLQDGKDYMIVGYPSARTMRQYTDIKEDVVMQEIHSRMKENNATLFSELFNSVLNSDDPRKINAPLEQEIYKFALGNRHYYYKSIINAYENLVTEWKITPEDYETFKSTFNTNVKNYFNTLGMQYLNKPLTRIRYTFFILEAQPNPDSNIKWIPAIFNVRQLELKHLPILEKLEKIIKLDIPFKFGIITKEEFESGSRYELFHSYYKYVSFFQITAEYMHIMSNFTDYAHNLKDSITLEELIYCIKREKDLVFPFWSQYHFEYKIRDYRILDDDVIKQTVMRKLYPERNIHSSRKWNSKRNFSKNNTQTNTYNTHNTKNTKKKENVIEENISNMQIIFIFEDTYAKYHIIYKKRLPDGTSYFGVMQIQSNMKYIQDKISKLVSISSITKRGQQRIKTVYQCGREYIKLLSFIYEKVNNFKILEDRQFRADDFKIIFKYNPGYVRKLVGIYDLDKIHIKYFYENELVKDESINPDLEIYNIYHELPILVKNYINSPLYIKGLESSSSIIKADPDRNIEDTNPEHFKKCADVLLPDCVINTIHYNPSDCGYNLIEIIDSKAGKKSIYVYPANSASSYIGNFLDLRESHLPLLKTIHRLYKRDDNLVFIHRASVLPKFYCLHFHILNNDNYSRKYPVEERGTFIIQELHIHQLIYYLENDKDFFKNYNVNLIM